MKKPKNNFLVLMEIDYKLNKLSNAYSCYENTVSRIHSFKTNI